jgi:hypothetical protein
MAVCSVLRPLNKLQIITSLLKSKYLLNDCNKVLIEVLTKRLIEQIVREVVVTENKYLSGRQSSNGENSKTDSICIL